MTNCVSLNGGDAAILEGIGHIMRSEFGDEIDITVHDDSPAAAASRVPFEVRPQLQALAGRARRPFALRRRLRARGDRELLERYSSADVIVSTGGTYLTGNYDMTPRIRELRLARALRRPLVLFTQSVGPLDERRARRALRRSLRDARLVLLRDERSRAELARTGLRAPRTELAADAAFALADPRVLESARERRSPPREPHVAVSVRAWAHFEGDVAATRLERYLEAIAGLVCHLVERRGARVTFISTCQGNPAYAHDDSVVADAICARLPGGVLTRVRSDREAHSPRELIARLGEFDLVVATRMHAAILALAGGALVLPIAYEPKMTDLAEQLGINRFAHEMDAISRRELCASADAMLGDVGAKLRPALFGEVERQRQSALATGVLVREALAA